MPAQLAIVKRGRIHPPVMQRRAASIYGAIFLVVALAAYGMIAAASPPAISVTNPDHRLANNSEFEVAGQSYAVTVDSESVSATLTWTNRSARHTATWEAGSTVTVDGTNYTVETAPDASPPRVDLTEARPLGEDVTTTTVDDTEYVVLGTGQNRTLVPAAVYLDDRYGPAATLTLAAGDEFGYLGNATTLTSVGNESATLAWTAPQTNTEDVSEGDVVTLNGRTFVAHFPNARTLVLDRDVEAYERQLAVRDTYDERINGLWGVTILSGLTVVGLLALSYLPSRY